MPKISIIIAVYEPTNIRYTELCIDSIRRNSKLSHEIILVVNPVLATTKYNHINADKILATEIQGQCHANNIGVSQVSNDWIMICDYDTVFPPDWEKALEKLEPETVLCLNCMEYGSRGIAPGFVFGNFGNIDNFDQFGFEEAAIEKSEDKIKTGFCYPFLVEKKYYLTVEGFDEIYDPWGSTCDSDFQAKCCLLGLNMKRYFGTICYHFGQTSPTYDDTNEMDYYRKGNIRNFESKWGFIRARSPQIWWNELIIPEDLLRYKPNWLGEVSKQWLGLSTDYDYWECSNCRFMNLIKYNICKQCKYEKKSI